MTFLPLYDIFRIEQYGKNPNFDHKMTFLTFLDFFRIKLYGKNQNFDKKMTFLPLYDLFRIKLYGKNQNVKKNDFFCHFLIPIFELNSTEKCIFRIYYAIFCFI